MSIDLQDRSSAQQRDRVIRRRLSLREPAAAQHRALTAVYRHWMSLGDAGLMPSRRDFDPRPLENAVNRIEIDVSELDDVDDEIAAQDYGAVRDLGTPLYHDVVAVRDGVTRSYARLILPFAADGRTVDWLTVCSADREFPDLLNLLR
jgi:DNA-binding transcriptional ArsR family regulator